MAESTRGQGKEAVRLCQHIVRQAFGNVVCRAATVLLNRGRLPLPTLARLAGLPMHTAAASTLILMQHNLVQTTSVTLLPDQASSSTAAAAEDQYEFDAGECLYRLRLGRILALTAYWPGLNRSGSIAEEIIRLVILHGRVQVKDFVNALGARADERRANAIHEALILLVRHRFLVPTSPQLQILRSEMIERRFKARKLQEQRTTEGKMISAPKLLALKRSAWEDIETERESAIGLEVVLIERKKIGAGKRKRDDRMEYELQQNVYLRINHDRYGILIRDDILAKAAEDKWNVGAGVIMRAVLDASLKVESLLRDAVTKQTVTLQEILNRIPDNADAEIRRGLLGSDKKDRKEIVRQYLDIMAGKDQLFANNGAFLEERTSGEVSTYSVAVERICVRLREALLAQFVRQKLDLWSARVLAVVIKAKIASEQTVRDCAMLSLKDARIQLARLQKLSIIETTEVPKTAAKRLAGSTGMDYHLWSVDLPRVYNNLLTGVYKTLANTLQRRASEFDRRETALQREEKARDAASSKRSGDPKAILSIKDLEELQELRTGDRKLLMGLDRSDSVAFILGELPGWPGSGR